MIQIRKTEFCLGPLWFWGFFLAVSAHSSRLQCGWPRAYPRSLAPWALLNGLVQPGKHRGLKRDAMIAEAVIRVHVQGGHSGPCVGESGYELFVRGTQSVVGRDIEDRMGGDLCGQYCEGPGRRVCLRLPLQRSRRGTRERGVVCRIRVLTEVAGTIQNGAALGDDNSGCNLGMLSQSSDRHESTHTSAQ